MRRWLRHVRRRELRFLALAVINLACIAGYVTGGVGVTPQEGGWRRIDYQAVEARMEAGELVRKEALWYHAASEEQSAGP